MDPLFVASGTILGFWVFVSPSYVVHLKVEPNGPSFIYKVCEKSMLQGQLKKLFLC